MRVLKKLLIIVIALIAVLNTAGCSLSEKVDYPEYLVYENKDLGCIELVYEGITYRPFGSFGNKKLMGTQIGIREGVPDSKIYEIKGYDSTQWIIDYLDVIMGGDMIFKAAGVTEIPSEFEIYRAYDY